MTTLLALGTKALPYLIAAIIAAALAVWVTSSIDDGELQREKTAHATDVTDLTKQLGEMSSAAADAQRKVDNDHRTSEAKIEQLDAQLTQEKQAHETDNRTYTSALAAGTQRLRVAVRSCSASSGNNVPAAPGATSVDDGATTYADIDPAVASRVFGVAGTDQQQIDKLKALQEWACAIRPDLPACAQ